MGYNVSAVFFLPIGMTVGLDANVFPEAVYCSFESLPVHSVMDPSQSPASFVSYFGDPFLALLLLLPGACFRAASVATDFLGAFPPVLILAVCLVLAMVEP